QRTTGIVVERRDSTRGRIEVASHIENTTVCNLAVDPTRSVDGSCVGQPTGTATEDRVRTLRIERAAADVNVAIDGTRIASRASGVGQTAKHSAKVAECAVVRYATIDAASI